MSSRDIGDSSLRTQIGRCGLSGPDRPEGSPSGASGSGSAHFDSLEGMEQAIATGVAEGMKACMGQIDALLADVAA